MNNVTSVDLRPNFCEKSSHQKSNSRRKLTKQQPWEVSQGRREPYKKPKNKISASNVYDFID